MSSQLLSLGAWYFLPNLVTGWVQTVYYRTTVRAGDPYPQPGSQRHERHRRNIFILVILTYLLYTIYEVDWELQREGDFYTHLGVVLDADEKRINSRFRRLTILYHPDKLQNPSPEQLAASSNYYVHLKNARDTLVDPAKRYAYERFGPSMLEWKNCITKLDYITVGLKQLVPYYLLSALTLTVMSFMRYNEYGRYWQFFSIAALLIFEAHTISRPTFPLPLRLLNPLTPLLNHAPYLPYQAIALARRIALSVFIAVSQIAPQLRRAAPVADTQQSLSGLYALANELDGDAARLLRLETVPFLDDEELEARLKRQTKAWLVQNEIRNDKGVDQAIRAVLARRMEAEMEGSGTTE
ncbi:membrane associated DnaJ chaperone-like protein [Microthyrium microscopicum]|uniref:Membrane associated DnaJ chaperone-like protein n=1 Tax=Microthyrium microscopicum TaxID=703497 RepID=A0A6A6UGN1_9PEZI|nr:membrane associated DnaJ chaperone-like protein [Microthyrium microscopicum]